MKKWVVCAVLIISTFAAAFAEEIINTTQQMKLTIVGLYKEVEVQNSKGSNIYESIPNKDESIIFLEQGLNTLLFFPYPPISSFDLEKSKNSQLYIINVNSPIHQVLNLEEFSYRPMNQFFLSVGGFISPSSPSSDIFRTFLQFGYRVALSKLIKVKLGISITIITPYPSLEMPNTYGLIFGFEHVIFGPQNHGDIEFNWFTDISFDSDGFSYLNSISYTGKLSVFSGFSMTYTPLCNIIIGLGINKYFSSVINENRLFSFGCLIAYEIYLPLASEINNMDVYNVSFGNSIK
ncbi:MAG: hypothetical protein A2014_06005 [Spirochaetes bacterium GWF1_49_6]|nr:MAG: hypothetical protein A2014_06005 [Spirochaetes bacterium GWF1_49_6]